MKRLIIAIVLFVGAVGAATPQYTVEVGKVDSDGFPTTPARLCIIGTRHCYVPPRQDPPFGLHPTTTPVILKTGVRLVLFKAESNAGGSGTATHIALLDIRNGDPRNLLPTITLSNQSELRVWRLPLISRMPVVATADFVWADGETHFSRHRYRVKSYLYSDTVGHYLETDNFVTAKRYPGLDDASEIKVLESEKSKVIQRLEQAQLLKNAPK